MLRFKALFFSLLAAASCEDLVFPPGFQFGAASASYQVEGGWNASDKGEGVWDRFVHNNPHYIADGSTGDVACDSYHLWERDIEMAGELGLHFYRMSISWPRLLPSGFAEMVSEDGLRYYSDLIDGLLAKGIQPMVTLYHWDLPQSLQDLGGWTNPMIVDWFGEYARVVFSHFADRVKTWITINEPLAACHRPYVTGASAPRAMSQDVSTYLCNKYMLLAHAKAWRIYDEEFRPKYHGELSIANIIVWFEPISAEDEDLAETAMQFFNGRYTHPIYSKEGGWPPIVEEIMVASRKARVSPWSHIPSLTKEEIEYIRGTFDYCAVNHYTSRLVRRLIEGEPYGPLDSAPSLNIKFEVGPDWKHTEAALLYVYAPGIRYSLQWLREQYGDMKFIITENGFPTAAGLEDTERIEYYKEYLKELLRAIKEDGLNVTGYTAWTLMDNFEWIEGYTIKFGLYQVDFSSPEKTRTPKASAEFYKNLIQRNSLVPENSTLADD